LVYAEEDSAGHSPNDFIFFPRCVVAPQRLTQNLARLVVLFGGVVLLTGCPGDGIGKLVPVSGKVTIGNAPLTTGMLTFVPDAAKGNKAKASVVATVGSDGTYQLTTNGRSGAPLGWYKVTVNTMMPPTGAATGTFAPPVQINRKYQGPDTDLAIEVVEQPAPGAYDLKLSR
jgi:hypothetical protein